TPALSISAIRSSTLLLTSVDHPRAPGSRGCFTLSLLTTWVWVSMIMGVVPLQTDSIERPWESTTRPPMTKPRDVTRVIVPLWKRTYTREAPANRRAGAVPWPCLTKTTTRGKASASQDGRPPADADRARGWQGGLRLHQAVAGQIHPGAHLVGEGSRVRRTQIGRVELVHRGNSQ